MYSAAWARAWWLGPGRADQGRPWTGSRERVWALASSGRAWSSWPQENALGVGEVEGGSVLSDHKVSSFS